MKLILIIFLGFSLYAEHRVEGKRPISVNDSSLKESPYSSYFVDEVKDKNFFSEVISSVKSDDEKMSKMLEISKSSKWFCEGGEIVSGVSYLDKLFSMNRELEKKFKDYLSSKKGDFEKIIYKTLDSGEELGVFRYNLVLLELFREYFYGRGVYGLRGLALANYLPEEYSGVEAFFAEVCLKLDGSLSDKLKGKLKDVIDTKDAEKRAADLFKMAIDTDINYRQLYRNIILSFPKEMRKKLLDWLNRKMPGVIKDECDLLRLDDLVTKEPVWSRVFNEPLFSKAVLRRIVGDPKVNTPIVKSGNISSNLFGSIYELERSGDKRVKHLLNDIGEEARKKYEASKPYLALGEKADKDSLSFYKPTSSSTSERVRIPKEVTSHDLENLLRDETWYCDDNLWHSTKGNVRELLFNDEKLRNEFIASNAEVSKKHFARLMKKWRAGGFSSDDDLLKELYGFQSQYFLTEEAFKARELIVNLEKDEVSRKFYKAIFNDIKKRIGRESKEENISDDDFNKLFLMGWGTKDANINDKYRKIVLSLPKDLALEFNKYFSSKLNLGNEDEFYCYIPMGLDISLLSHDPSNLNINVLKLYEALYYKDLIDKNDRVNFLIATLEKSSDSELRRSAAFALGDIDPAAKDAIPALIKSLSDSDVDIRNSAAFALGKIGPAAVPALTKALANKDPYTRSSAAYALAKISYANKDAFRVLIKALSDSNDSVRNSTAELLGKIGPAAKDAIPSLIKALSDSNADVSYTAAKALGDIGPAAVPALIKALSDSDPDIRGLAAYALERIGPAAKDAIPPLIKALSDSDVNVRSSAAYTLGNIGPAAKDVVPALIKALSDSDAKVRSSAAYALGGIGPAALPFLIKAEKSQSEEVQKIIKSIISKINSNK